MARKNPTLPAKPSSRSASDARSDLVARAGRNADGARLCRSDPLADAQAAVAVVRAVEEFAANPRPGEVYNLGGGRANSISMLEAIERIEQMTGRKLDWRYVDEARKGDHICYISNLGKLKSHYPNWKVTRGLDAILEEIIASQRAQLAQATAR